MNDRNRLDDHLEESIRAWGDAQLGQPPPSAATWGRVQPRLAPRLPTTSTGDFAVEDFFARESFAPPPPRKRHPLTWMASVIAAALVVALAFGIFTSFHRAGGATSSTPAAGVVPLTPTTIPGATLNQALSSVSMDSPTDGWAVGVQEYSKGSTNVGEVFGLFDHFQSGTWTPSTIDLGAARNDGYLIGINSVSMISPTDGWAAAGIGKSGVFFHYDGHTWTRVEPPPGTGAIADVQMLSAHVGWAATAGVPARILRYDGTSWQVAYTEKRGAASGFNGLAMISADEGWAAEGISQKSGSFLPEDMVILHLQGGQWATEATFSNVNPFNLSLTANGEGWFSGQAFPTGNAAAPVPSVVQRHNGHWANVPLSLPNVVAWLGVDAANGWLGGQYSSVPGKDHVVPVILHEVNGAWQQVAVPAVFVPTKDIIEVDVANFAFLTPDDGWAVGYVYTDSNVATALILHYQNGTWSIVQD